MRDSIHSRAWWAQPKDAQTPSFPIFPVFPLFLLPSPLSQTHWGQSPDHTRCHPQWGPQHPVWSRAGLSTRSQRLCPLCYPRHGCCPGLWLCLTVKGLRARGTPRAHLTKSAGQRLKPQVAALKAFPLPVPFLSTDKVVTVMFVPYEFSLVKISCPLADRFRRTRRCLFPSLLFWFSVCLKPYEWLPASSAGSLKLRVYFLSSPKRERRKVLDANSN